ncbi:cytochrome c [Azospirillum sp. SYSU D00513]|uniref:cytochrome c n=1 Tax=Azospirillum sp. SYSU D00513 TaxID=2812561 RepID=UPI001A9671DA|nr:cytochrome c [Azospirillum sp. SYSU D00513]
MRISAYFSGALLVLLLLGAGFHLFAWRSEIAPVTPAEATSFDVGTVRKGASLAAIGNCSSCHTTPGGESFAGGLPIRTPFGTIYSTNITPDEETGIGRWSEAAFIRAMREGVDRQGRHLYPAFPYDHFTLVTDEDNRAIYAYLMTRRPVRARPPENELPFPLNVRTILAGWKLLFFEEGVFQPDPSRGDAWNRGAYLAEGLGHCGACHTPRNQLGARRTDRHWAGGQSQGWTAYPINAESPAPVPWDQSALTFYLRHGWHEAHGVSRGPMAEVTNNLGTVPHEEVATIAAYTAEVMGTPSPQRQDRAKELLAASPTGRGVGPSGDTQAVPSGAEGDGAPGGRIYASACASCHDSGRPLPFGGLPFSLSTAVNAANPQNIINVTLFGLPPANGQASAVMPAYGGVLSDEQMVALLDHLRARYTDKPAWEGLMELVRNTRSGAHYVTVMPADALEQSPGPLGVEK